MYAFNNFSENTSQWLSGGIIRGGISNDAPPEKEGTAASILGEIKQVLRRVGESVAEFSPALVQYLLAETQNVPFEGAEDELDLMQLWEMELWEQGRRVDRSGQRAYQPLNRVERQRIGRERPAAETIDREKLGRENRPFSAAPWMPWSPTDFVQAAPLPSREPVKPRLAPNDGSSGRKGIPMGTPPVQASRRKAVRLGEQQSGTKTDLLPKRLYFVSDTDLASKLWDHYVHGEGQPVAIDLGQLDFSGQLNSHRLFSFQAKQVMLAALKTLPQDTARRLLETKTHKRLDAGFPAGNGRVTHIHFQDGFSEVRPSIPETDFGKFVAFGRIGFQVTEVEILVDHEKRQVTVQALLCGNDGKEDKRDNWLDTYDFDHDPRRGDVANAIVNGIREFAPAGSTRFEIYAVPQTASKYRRIYTFEEFLSSS